MAIHKFSGQCTPGKGYGYKTFSVGCYEVGPHKSGKGEKRIGPVKVRVIGDRTNYDSVKATAKEICDQLDAGTYTGPKHVTVK